MDILPKHSKASMGNSRSMFPVTAMVSLNQSLIPKYQRDISGIEEKVISLYARGMSTRDIHDQLQELYGIELSAEMVSKITDKILPEVKEWQSRPLNPVYPFRFSWTASIIRFVKTAGFSAVLLILYWELPWKGYKEILSITVGANETSKFWLGMLNDLKKSWCAGCAVFSA